jgi:hypothetical protein
MPARSSFDYALVRVVPRVEREEFLNAGAIVFCRTRAFLDARIELDTARLLAFAPWVDLVELRAHLEVIPLVCGGAPEAGPIAALSQAERFHWLVAPRSTIVQPSPVHTGLTNDPAAALEHLMATMVRLPTPGSVPDQ